MRQDVYRVAYDEAAAELIEIRSKFEQMLMRKSRLEGVIAVLGPLLGASALASPEAVPGQGASAPQANGSGRQEPGAFTFNQIPNPLPNLDETGGDPFKRRVRNALQSTPLGTQQPGLQTAV